MIRAGIFGGETLAAGELIRILINHPDVELCTVGANDHVGTYVADFHSGLTGDTELQFASNSDVVPQKHDVVFLCGEVWQAREWMRRHEETASEKGVRVIDLTGAFRGGEYDMVYGLAEYNRKALVRGATCCSLPSEVAQIVELAIFPLAKNHILGGEIIVEVTIPVVPKVMSERIGGRSILDVSTRFDPIAPAEFRHDNEAISQEIERFIRMMQTEFKGRVRVRLSSDPQLQRVMKAKVLVPCSEYIGDLNQWYDDAYQDHNFTYPVKRTPVVSDVCNTNKCLLKVEYPDIQGYNAAPSTSPAVEIDAVADGFLKGGAGNGVHVMNLLFGLSERTGLALKASAI